MSLLYESKFITSIVFFISIYIITQILNFIINKRINNVKKKHLLRKWLYYFMVITFILFSFELWSNNNISITTILGYISAGLALALHQVLLNIAGWLLIIFRKPYNIGDRIERNNIVGDVIDIRMFYTVVMEVGNWVEKNQSTGRIINIPNGKIFTEFTFNYTIEFDAIWDEINILLTFDSNYKKAEKIIKKILNDTSNKKFLEQISNNQEKMSKKYALKQGKLTPITYIDIKESGISFQLRYLVPVRLQRKKHDLINRKILDRFNEESDIEFAYPSRSIYYKKKPTND
ncbi:MAG: mechanosensitive ion channel family protein [Bacillota bacterium]